MRLGSMVGARGIILGMVSLVLFGCATGSRPQAGAVSMEDRLAIQDLLNRYAHYVDNGLGDAWASTFTPDGRLRYFDNVIEGREALAAFAGKSMPFFPTHFVGNTLMVETRPGEVHARSMVIVAARLKKEVPTELIGIPVPALTEVLGVGIYDDTIVKTQNGWRFKERRAGSTGTAPFHSDFLPAGAAAPHSSTTK